MLIRTLLTVDGSVEILLSLLRLTEEGICAVKVSEVRLKDS